MLRKNERKYYLKKFLLLKNTHTQQNNAILNETKTSVSNKCCKRKKY